MKTRWLFLLLVLFVGCTPSEPEPRIYLQISDQEVPLTQTDDGASLRREIIGHVEKAWTSRRDGQTEWLTVCSVLRRGPEPARERLGVDSDASIISSCSISVGPFRLREEEDGTCVLERQGPDGPPTQFATAVKGNCEFVVERLLDDKTMESILHPVIPSFTDAH